MNFEYVKMEKRLSFSSKRNRLAPTSKKDESMRTPLTVVQTDNGGDSMKAMVERIARALVDQPEAVSVSGISSAHSLIVELKVAKDDLGKVIGKQGRTACAMRTIVNAVAAKNKKHTVLEIIE